MSGTIVRPTKGIVFDSANFWASCHDLGVGDINYQKLVGYLKHAVGTVASSVCCKATIRPDFCNSRRQLFHDMKRAGIDLISASSAGSADDLEVKRCLCKFFKQPEIAEIVIISADHDVVQEALELSKRYANMNRFCQLYILASATPSNRGCSPISRETLNDIESCACAHFVGLEPIVKECAFGGARH